MDKRFSFEAFEACGRDTDVAHELADRLQDAVLEALQPELLRAFDRVVEQLRALGHDLQPYYDPRPGDISYRALDDQDRPALRLGLDLVISAGFAHVTSEDDQGC